MKEELGDDLGRSRQFLHGVVNKIIDGINKVTGILSKLPGVADQWNLGNSRRLL